LSPWLKRSKSGSRSLVGLTVKKPNVKQEKRRILANSRQIKRGSLAHKKNSKGKSLWVSYHTLRVIPCRSINARILVSWKTITGIYIWIAELHPEATFTKNIHIQKLCAFFLGHGVIFHNALKRRKPPSVYLTLARPKNQSLENHHSYAAAKHKSNDILNLQRPDEYRVLTTNIDHLNPIQQKQQRQSGQSEHFLCHSMIFRKIFKPQHRLPHGKFLFEKCASASHIDGRRWPAEGVNELRQRQSKIN